MNALDAINRMQFPPHRLIVQIDTLKFKALAYRIRKGDGHVITRRGRVVSARVTGGVTVFQLERFYD